MSDELTLGRKLYALREDRKYSQSRLEVEADLSFGTISRVENGLINPTKETLFKLSKVLRLDNKEFHYLLSPVGIFPNIFEVEEIVNVVEEKIDKLYFPLFVRDNRFRIWFCNEILLTLFGISREIALRYRGVNMFELLFSNEIQIIGRIPEGRRTSFLTDQVEYYKNAVHKYRTHPEIQKDLKNLDNHIKELEPLNSESDVDPTFDKSIYFKYKNSEIEVSAVSTDFLIDSRFTLLTYYPANANTFQIFEKIRNS